MFYSPLFNKAASKLTTRGALQYVYQDPNSGEFVASDGTVMLIENNGTPFMAKFWDTITQMPANCVEEYPDWKNVLSNGIKNTNRLWFADRVRLYKGFAIFDRFYISAKIYQLVQDFIGSEMVINIPSLMACPIYFRNNDETHQALVMPYNIIPEKPWNYKWNVLDPNGTIIYTTDNIKEAELFGLTVKMVGDK